MKIRIVVAVDEAGRHLAFSVGYGDHEIEKRYLIEHLDRHWKMRMGKGFPYHVSVVEADVPLPPESVVVRGEVEE